MILLYLTTKAKQASAYIPFFGWVSSIIGIFPAWVYLGPSALLLVPSILSLSYLVFKDTLNKVQSIGHLYWIVRDYGSPNTPRIGMGFMHEIDPPWRHGRGIQIKAFKWYIQVGWCHKNENLDEAAGILAAVQGRFMDIDPIEIGKW